MRTTLRALALGAVLSVPAAAQPSPAEAPPSPAAARVRAVADAYVTASIARFPELAEQVGDATPPARWVDNSPAALRAWERTQDDLLAQLRQVDEAALFGTPDWLTHGMLREQLEASAAGRVCRFELWGVDQIFGWHLALVTSAARQPVASEAERRTALARWRALPAFVDREIANAREGLAKGYAAPRANVERVIDQLQGMVTDSVEGSPMWSPAERDSSPAWRQAWSGVLREQVNPSLRRYLAFLQDEYLPRARAGSGVSDLPEGEACYRAIIRGYTSLDLSPQEMRDRARAARVGMEAELAAISTRLTGVSDPRQARQVLKTDARFSYGSREAKLEQTRAQLDRLRAMLPRAFGRVPESPLALEAVPAFQERSAPPAWYESAPLDGSRPGTYFTNLGGAETSPRMDLAPSTTHEGWPGHHMQQSWVRERPVSHPVQRLLGTGSYTEGWGMYAERIAYEEGMFDDDLMRAGLLAHLVDALVGLELDPSIHVFGVTRAAAVDSMMAISARPRTQAEVYADRHAATPGQLASYMTGYLEIVRLREEARRALGPRFDLRAFHDVVLDDGAVTLPMLRTKVERWVAEGGPKPAR